jgi:hypothetical protein
MAEPSNSINEKSNKGGIVFRRKRKPGKRDRTAEKHHETKKQQRKLGKSLQIQPQLNGRKEKLKPPQHVKLGGLKDILADLALGHAHTSCNYLDEHRCKSSQ